MPYIVTKHGQWSESNPDAHHGRTVILSRRAVATLDEARDGAHAAVHAAYRAAYPILPRGLGGEHSDAQRAHYRASCAVSALPESGGTVGPLPDGSVIEVEEVAWEHIFYVGHPRDQDLPRSAYGEFELIDAYNAAQA